MTDLLEDAGVDVGQRHDLFLLFVHALKRENLMSDQDMGSTNLSHLGSSQWELIC